MKKTNKKLFTGFLMLLLLLVLCIPVSAATTSTKTSSKTTSKTTSKRVTLSKPATKTYSKTLPATTKTSSKTSKSENKKEKKVTVTKTTVTTAVTEKYTKNSKYKVVSTKVTTTVKTTITTTHKKYTLSIDEAAPKAGTRIRNAWKTLGFTVVIDPAYGNQGILEINTRTLTLGKESDLIYEQLGNFLTWVASATLTPEELNKVFVKEFKESFGRTPQTFLAETYKEYCLNKTATKKAKPKTTALIEKSLSTLTTSHLNTYNKLYKNLWAKYSVK